jgi:hypothetical protein
MDYTEPELDPASPSTAPKSYRPLAYPDPYSGDSRRVKPFSAAGPTQQALACVGGPIEDRTRMTIVEQLSSQTGDRTEASNRAVAWQCLTDAAALEEIAGGLESEDERLAGDCAEVMTKVAETKPALVNPYA